MPFVTIDGQALHYLDQGTGPAVLLAGSYLWDQAMWAPQIAALSQQYRVIALDLWGHGQSGPLPAGTMSLDDIARQALALLDHLDIDRVTLVGLSVGGMWGVRLALSAAEAAQWPGVDGHLRRRRTGADAPVLLLAVQADRRQRRRFRRQLLDIVVPIFFRPGIDPQSALYQDFRGKLAALPPDRLRESIVPMGRYHVWS